MDFYLRVREEDNEGCFQGFRKTVIFENGDSTVLHRWGKGYFEPGEPKFVVYRFEAPNRAQADKILDEMEEHSYFVRMLEYHRL